MKKINVLVWDSFHQTKIKFTLVLSNSAQLYVSALREQGQVSTANRGFSESFQGEQSRTQWTRGQRYSPHASRWLGLASGPGKLRECWFAWLMRIKAKAECPVALLLVPDKHWFLGVEASRKYLDQLSHRNYKARVSSLFLWKLENKANSVAGRKGIIVEIEIDSHARSLSVPG